MDQSRERHLLEELVRLLAEERHSSVPASNEDLWRQFRALVNTRPPWPASEQLLDMQDELLQGMIARTGISGPDDAEPSPDDTRMRLWQGDITTFAADAIVNAANSQMLGCWVPGHHCIDNAIHTFAGVQLRIECARIMDEQGHEEPTGSAKITSAYNLPSKHVIHTVGPIADGHPSETHCKQLAACYKSCLALACEHGLNSIAFCGISTGVFGFPREQAAEIAVQTVREWLNESGSDMTVVFNVFGEAAERIYRAVLSL